MGGESGNAKKYLGFEPSGSAASLGWMQKAKDKRDKDKATSQGVINTAQNDAAKIQEVAATAEEKALALAQAEIDNKRRSMTQTILTNPYQAAGQVKRKTLLGQ